MNIRAFMASFRRSKQIGQRCKTERLAQSRRRERIERRQRHEQTTQEKDRWPLGFRVTVEELFDR